MQNPGSCFIKAAKCGVEDNLRGSLDALAWGNCPSIGTSGQFDILYSDKVKPLVFLSIKFLAANQVLMDHDYDFIFKEPKNVHGSCARILI